MKRLVYLLPLVVLLGFAALLFTGLRNNSGNEIPSTLIGQTMPALPELALAGFEGEKLDELLKDNKIVIINYFASWCGPCRAEHPNLIALKEMGIPIIGINYKDKPEKAAQFITEMGNPFAGVLVDDSGRVAIDWGVSGVPESFFVNQKRQVVYRFFGPITGTKLKDEVLPQLEALSK